MTTDVPARLLSECIDEGWSICGVPCSVLWSWFEQVPSLEKRIRIAPNEGEAVAFSAGVWLGGGFGVAFMQNSGLGNAVNAITSLLHPFSIPIMCLISWRGVPGAFDEPQHRLMGAITERLLSLCALATFDLRKCADSAPSIRTEIEKRVALRQTPALLLPSPARSSSMKKREHQLPAEFRKLATIVGSVRKGHSIHSRELLEVCSEEIDSSAALVATTGYCSRELFAIADRPNRFYMPGSMGHAASLGLGIAEQTQRTVVVLDGDGALLMRLGSLVLLGASSRIHIIHILLNNGVHESTGGQPVVGHGCVSFSGLARECGYSFVGRCDDIVAFRELLRMSLIQSASAFIEAFVGPRSALNLPRIPDCFPDLAVRFRENRRSLCSLPSATGC